MTGKERLDSPMRILFASIHCYLDTSSGAAISARQVMELMAERGHTCRVLTAGVLDYHEECTLESFVESIGIRQTTSDGIDHLQKPKTFKFEVGGVGIKIMPTRSSNAQTELQSTESAEFLDMADLEIKEFKPDILITYGGQPAVSSVIRLASMSGCQVVFFLRNLAYTWAGLFARCSGVLVDSEFVREHYAKTLGIACTAIPSPISPRLESVP